MVSEEFGTLTDILLASIPGGLKKELVGCLRLVLFAFEPCRDVIHHTKTQFSNYVH